MSVLAVFPAVGETSCRHMWGCADKLFKSEAIGVIGFACLTGVLHIILEVKEAFTNLYAGFGHERTDMEDELDQWSKQEQARLVADVASQVAMKVVMEQG